MSTVDLNNSMVGTGLQQILLADDIQPGSSPSYQLCKTIYEFHPLGAKIAEKPIRIAQSQKRKIAVPDSPEERIVKQFNEQWKKDGIDKQIFRTAVLSRIYGISSIAVLTDGVRNEQPLDYSTLWKQKISFNAYDPLNTSGSLVLNQDPLAMDFQHAQEIRVDGSTFHRSRARVIMNEFPIYISYTPSAFGFTGRSVYQRSLYPLKSFIQTMITNDMVSVKAGVLVAKMEQAGSVVTQMMQKAFGIKRNLVKEAKVGNILGIGKEEFIESIDLKNLAEPFGQTRKFIIEDIASGAPMPAKMLTEESFAEGFGEGTEDAKEQARYIDGIREELAPLYDFFDKIIMHRAWNPDFYEIIRADYPEQYGNMDYEAAFYKWANSFAAEWPSLLTEPESEQVKVADVKLSALIKVLEVLMPRLPPDQVAVVVQFVADNMNEMKLLFGNPLYLDYEALANYKPQEQFNENDAPGSFSMADSADGAIADLKAAVARLPDIEERLRRIQSRKDRK